MTQVGHRATLTVRILFALTAVGMLTFMAVLFTGSLGARGLIVPLGIVLLVSVSLFWPPRQPNKLRVTASMANGFIALGTLGLAVSVLFLALPTTFPPVMERAPLVALGLTMAFMVALGAAARKGIPKLPDGGAGMRMLPAPPQRFQ